jgi:mannose-6-phosphate isomerase-like protein (cupin superfamily)
MSEEQFKKEWGLEVTWASEDNYAGKILIFNKQGDSTPFHFHKETKKTWFVNSGKFMVRWIDTTDGKVYQQELTEGKVFTADCLVPVSLEALVPGSSVIQASNQNDSNDYYTLIPGKNIGV